MDVFFKDSKLGDLYNDGEDTGAYPPGVVGRFVRAINYIKRSKSINDLYAMKSFHCEKLDGKYKGKMSIRINDSRRAIFSVGKQGDVQVIAIEELSNHCA